MKYLAKLSVLIGASVAAALPAKAVTLTFDDIDVPPGQYTSLIDYAGFHWYDIGVENHIFSGGYSNGIVSQPNAIFVGGGGVTATMSSTSLFSFESGYFAQQAGTGSAIITGYRAGVQIYQDIFDVNETTPVFHVFDWSGIDTVSMIGTNFNLVMDDFSVRQSGAVPEPASWAMMIGGFGMVGSALRRRRMRGVAAA